MKQNVFMKVFFGSVIWTAACLGLAAYAANKAQQQDPEIVSKISDRVQSTSNIHISVNGSNDRDFLPSEDTWTFPTPADKIEVRTISGDVEVVSGKAGSALTVTAKGRRHKTQPKLLNTEATREKVVLEQPENDTTRNLKVQLNLPQDYKGRLIIKTVSGDTELESLTLNSLNAESVSGDLKVENSAVKEIEQSTISGEVTVENKIPANIKMKSVSGDVKLQVAKNAKTRFELESMSGEVTNALPADSKGTVTVQVKSMSGDIEIR